LNNDERNRVKHLVKSERLYLVASVDTLDTCYRCFGDVSALEPLITEARLYLRNSAITLDYIKHLCWTPQINADLLGKSEKTGKDIDQSLLAKRLDADINDGFSVTSPCQFAYQAGGRQRCTLAGPTGGTMDFIFLERARYLTNSDSGLKSLQIAIQVQLPDLGARMPLLYPR